MPFLTDFLGWVECCLAYVFTSFGWGTSSKKGLISVTAASGCLLIVCLLCSKPVHTPTAIKCMLIGAGFYLLTSSAIHLFLSERITTKIEQLHETYITISWLLRCILSLGVAVAAVFLTAYIEHHLRWDIIAVGFYFSVLVHIATTVKIYKREDFFGGSRSDY